LGDSLQDIENITALSNAIWLDGRTINDNGEICGKAQFSDLTWRGFVASTSFNLLTGPLSGDPVGVGPYGINNAGDIVGDDDFDAFLIQSNGNGGHDFYYLGGLLEPGPETDFWNSGNDHPDAYCINDNGQIFATKFVQSGRGRNSPGEMRLYVLSPIITTPTPGISVIPTTRLVTTESGGTDFFDVVLNTQPSADVTIGISSSDTSEGMVDVSSLTFTPADWNIPQTVTITGVDDAIEDGDVAYTVITAQTVSTDPDYNGLDADDVSVTNLDDDGPSGGGSESYSVLDDPNWQAIAIPDNNPQGVSSTISVADNHQITGLTVTLDINHQRPSDLQVLLNGPNGTQVPLTNFTGDNSVPDFNGISSAGDWTLQVVDTRNRRDGTLNSWSITVDF
jgi:hypothetical protein